MDREPVMDLASQLSETRRSAAVLLIQLGKKAKVMENLDSSKGLELAVVPHMALTSKDGRITISSIKRKKWRPLGAKNKGKRAYHLSTTIVDCCSG
ncbi:hypothetical protein M0R45_008780 [Rubus argutus]|uniref:Uncharacterized protein n=1 Tax=Rubus argutus TaxID=59490 RepID=A0AAW1Y2Q5_RUBAR